MSSPESHWIWMILGSAFNAALLLVAAPFCEGVLRKVTARIQSRQGPPLWQPYFDLLKLLGKEDLESGESPLLQRIAAYLALGVTLATAALLPLGLNVPLAGAADMLLLVYLLTLGSIAILLAGLAAGSPFSLLGVNREMMTMILVEPLLVVALILAALNTGSFRLDAIFDGGVYASRHFPWSGLILCGVLLVAFQAFVKRVPFDIAEAETEIMEGPLVEYSGPKLALFKHAQMAKLILHSALFSALFLPWGNHLVFPVGFLVFWAKVFGLVLLVTLVAATHARYRIDQALRFFALLLAISVGGLVLATFGY